MHIDDKKVFAKIKIKQESHELRIYNQDIGIEFDSEKMLRS